MRVLLVEDDSFMVSALSTALSRQSILVDHACNLEYAREAFQASAYDAVLLDRKLPDGEGLSLIPHLRSERPGVPVIVLSALSSPEHRVEGLDTGADDYLPKPFSTDELLARIRAVMRRPADIANNHIILGKLRFDLNERFATVDGEILDLTRRELLALEVLVSRAGRAVSRAALEEAVYSLDDELASNALESHISRLRRKLSGSDVEIHSIRGIGYLLRVTS